MIISQLDGGLGNQFFEYATGRLIAKKNNVNFFIDPGYLLAFRFHKKCNRSPEILKMCLKSNIASRRDIRRFIFSSGISSVDMYFRRFKFFDKNVYKFPEEDLDNMKNKKNAYLIGFVSGDFFKTIKKDLELEFSLKDKINIINILKDVRKNNSVSIHVRRGDLLENGKLYPLSIDYYKQAVDYLKDKKKNLKFYIFSDDIAWCEKKFRWIENVIFVKNNSVTEDFELMKNCKYNILANSTLSWWVGYLGKSKIVIAPKHFGASKNDSCSDLILKNWITF